MSRPISPQALDNMNQLVCDDVWLALLDVWHPSWGSTRYRIVNDRDRVVSNGQVYLPHAFNIVLANMMGDQLPKVKLTVDNVDRSLIANIRRVASPIQVRLMLIIKDSPNQVEVDLPNLLMRDVTYNAEVIEGHLVIDEILGLRYPKGSVKSTNYPSVF